MSNLLKKYKDTIAAGRALEGGVWALALALAKDVQGGGTAKEATEALKEAGVTSTSGDPYKYDWLNKLVSVGTIAFEEDSELRNYPVSRVYASGTKHEWDPEAMLLTLRANGTLHEIGGTSPLGRVDRFSIRRELDRLGAEERAKLATDLVSQREVREAILRSDPIAREQHIVLGGQIARESTERSERRGKELNPVNAAREAADEISLAANHLNNALAEIIQWGVTVEHDRLRRVQSGMVRVERAVSEINSQLGIEVA